MKAHNENNAPSPNENIIRDNLDVEKLGLTLVEKEYKTMLGRIDILAEDEYGNLVPIEIKLGEAGDQSIGQILGYMKAVDTETGIIVAASFSERVKAVSTKLCIKLLPYTYNIAVSKKSVAYDGEEYMTSITKPERVSGKQKMSMEMIDMLLNHFGTDRWFVQPELHGVTKHTMDALVEKEYLEIMEWNDTRYYRRLKSMKEKR